ncbi:MAG TPA: ribonuclease HII [Deltaproteobacteria bacterium]|nr:ribonuclease HII [Deltaproteobacteria bacterium]HPR53640.1 ribonuclease HII [Deltaproteobacteria bacterium]HXK47156.1 ribonuclease HII [Deltaproteobacteria bacterium]
MPLEDELIARGVWPLCGVDEAGRGPLAGPVVAAAVIMEPSSALRSSVKDSKQLTAARREKLYEMLVSSDDVRFGTSIVEAPAIDAMNILKATLMAMEEAVGRLRITPSAALVDGNAAPAVACRCYTVVKGDQTEPSISAASIIAKVTRDRIMARMEEIYPGYGFARHKGYPTKDHYEAIHRLGACPIHRRSFKGVS